MFVTGLCLISVSLVVLCFTYYIGTAGRKKLIKLTKKSMSKRFLHDSDPVKRKQNKDLCKTLQEFRF